MTVIKKGSRGYDVLVIQEYLTALGYYTNGVDGIFGSGMEKAVKEFQEIYNLDVDGIVGKDTASTIATNYHSLIINTTLPWMHEALEDYFVSEIKGEKHSTDVLQMWKDAKLGGIQDDETPWCAGAVSAWLERAGIRSQRTAWARNYLNQGVELKEPVYGCIVVFERGSGGHVGFVTGVSKDGKQIRVLGANQSNSVNERMFDVSRVLGYRMPVVTELPVVGNGKASDNEA